jgi:hypothetical protein
MNDFQLAIHSINKRVEKLEGDFNDVKTISTLQSQFG